MQQRSFRQPSGVQGETRADSGHKGYLLRKDVFACLLQAFDSF